MNKSFSFLALTFIVIVCLTASLSSCRHKDDDKIDSSTTGTTETPKGNLQFHLHTYIDNNEVDLYNTNYTTDDGRKVSLQLAQLYISGIQLVKIDGSLLTIPGKKILMQRDIATYNIGDVPVGNYKAVRFKIGLDPATNALSPDQSPDSVLLNHPEMWFGNTAQPDGYIFMTAKGKIDTSENADGTVSEMRPFSYNIGTNSHYTQIIMPDKNFSVYPDQTGFLHVIVDYYKLFNGIGLNNSQNLSAVSVQENSQTPATIIAGNIPLLFRYEE